jgi:hypothetical protein
MGRWKGGAVVDLAACGTGVVRAVLAGRAGWRAGGPGGVAAGVA